jgi:hypothetical protein
VLYIVPTLRALVVLRVPARRTDRRSRRLSERRRRRGAAVVVTLRSSIGLLVTLRGTILVVRRGTVR